MERAAVADNSDQERRARRLRVKNLTVLAMLLGFVVLVYLVSIVRMGGG